LNSRTNHKALSLAIFLLIVVLCFAGKCQAQKAIQYTVVGICELKTHVCQNTKGIVSLTDTVVYIKIDTFKCQEFRVKKHFKHKGNHYYDLQDSDRIGWIVASKEGLFIEIYHKTKGVYVGELKFNQ
jgi:hypothetical protein